ncbi:hypothetical protein BKM78_08155 [Tessaracoccus sp. T2.5-30]|nr:hypothetical protein BKM78_08155 [Tessaracoccus sp. T2.5-30]
MSGAGIAARYEALTGQATTAREVAARAQGGAQVALNLLQTAGEALGDALADLAAVLDPERIIIGGGWGTADTPLASTAHAVYARRTGRRADAARLVPALLGHRSGLLGGGAAGIRALTQTGSGCVDSARIHWS